MNNYNFFNATATPSSLQKNADNNCNNEEVVSKNKFLKIDIHT